MSDHVIKSTPPVDLRSLATSRLAGASTAGGSTGMATDALAVLHALASSPATAADALALLHELQVHQVEVDMQAQELRESRAELESALRRQSEVYEFQPVGCFTVDRHLVISELNRAGARMLGVERDVACGLGLDTFLAAGSLGTLQGVVAALADGGVQASTGFFALRPKDGQAHPVRADVGLDPSGDGFFVVLTSTDGR